MPYQASVIANEFVRIAISEGNPVTQMKLQKMLYFAQGVHLAIHGEPLIKESFQAWKFGPVIPEIYQTFKFYGSDPITDTYWLYGYYRENKNNKEALDDKARKTIEITWNSTKTINAAQLSNWTHRKDSPWDKYYVEGVNDSIIPNDDITSYFKKFLVTSK